MIWALAAGALLLLLGRRLLFPRRPFTPPKEEGYFEAQISPELRRALLAWVEKGTVLPGAAKRSLETALLAARRHDLPADTLPWAEIEGYMRKARCSFADAIYDLSRRNPD